MSPEAICSIVSFLHKTPRAGTPTNLANPKDYRALTLGRAVTKIFATVILVRLTHWVRTHKVVPTTHQGAFSPGLGGIWALYTFIECIRHEWAAGRSLFTLLIDFTQAYDKVNPVALNIMLRELGVPENLAALILNWMLSRTVKLRVNGALSEPLPVKMGTGQGDVPAPLYFNIFINLLALYIKSLPNVSGVTIVGFAIKIIMFADDVNNPTTSYAATQVVLTATNKWSDAWGMKINVKPGKTEGMAFFSPQAITKGEHLIPLEPLQFTSDGVTHLVKWTTNYQYLGYPLTPSMPNKAHGDMRGRMMVAYARLFGYNVTLWHTNPVLRDQLFKAFVIGSVSYLMPLVRPVQNAIDSINAAIFPYIRRSLGLGKSAPTALLQMEAAVPSALQIIVRARTSLGQTLMHTYVRDAPAVLLSEAIALTYRNHQGATASWVHTTKKFMAVYEALGVPPPVPVNLSAVKSTTAAYARAVAYAVIRETERKEAIALRIIPSIKRPRNNSARQFAADLSFGYSQLNKLGNIGPATPLSIRGPGCSGSLLLRTSTTGIQHLINLLASARLGVKALSTPPVSPASWLLPDDATDDDWRNDAIGRTCPLCQVDNEMSADSYHILCECTHATVVAARENLQMKMKIFLLSLAESCYDAQSASGQGAPLLGITRAARNNFIRTIENIVWTSEMGNFLLFRCCLVLPYPADCVALADRNDNPVWYLGQLFDSVCVRDSDLRDVANIWVKWGGLEYLQLTNIWTSAVNAMPPVV